MRYLERKAFPMNLLDQVSENQLGSVDREWGIDIEDYFAAAALNGLLASGLWRNRNVSELCDDAVEYARGMAGAMARAHQKIAEVNSGKTNFRHRKENEKDPERCEGEE